MAARTTLLSALLAVVVGCGSQPPPSQIPVDVALAVIKPLEPSLVSCGGMEWEGQDWPMYSHQYSREVDSPWFDWPVWLKATFVYSGKDHFLTAIIIDGHEYRRDNRSEDILTWRRQRR